jgi:predicted metal-dependent phosphoesterase TrpH
MRIDAHCHTNCSDGSITIEERITMIKACGFDAATITDHDFISREQIKRAEAACSGLPFIPGMELSLRHESRVVHLLGYFIDPDNSRLKSHLSLAQLVDKGFTDRLLKYFQKLGVGFSIEELESDSLHTFYSLQLVKRIARDLFSKDPQKCMPAFLQAMSEMGFSYPDLAPWDVKNAIDLIHQAGGIAVLAHPGGRNDTGMAALGFLFHEENHIGQYAGWGLDGIETNSPVHTEEEKRSYLQLAAKYDLLATAGSDCHGDDPYLGPALMGKYMDIPEDSYERLLDFHQKKGH